MQKHNWLSTEAKKEYSRRARGKGLTESQKELLALAIDSYETYIAAKQELDAYVEKENTLTTKCGNQLRPHPSIGTMKVSLDSYLKALTKIEKLTPAQKDTDDGDDELDELLTTEDE